MNRYDLFEYKNETAYINQQLEDIEARRNKLTKITSAYKENYGGAYKDKLSEGVAEMVDIENDLLEKIKSRLRERKLIEEAVANMKNDRYQRTILYLLYISENPISLTNLCAKLPKNYDYKYVSKLHIKALEEFDKKYENKLLIGEK